MARLLRELMGAREPAYSIRLRHLESATAQHHVDVQLSGEIISSFASKLTSLGLDPTDTTEAELYAVLMRRADESDTFLKERFKTLKQLHTAIEKRSPTTQIPVIKSAAIRKILAKHPPKKVMSVLGYRSAASLLKRGDINQIMIGAQLLESLTWHRKFSRLLKSLQLSDITMSKPSVVIAGKKLTDSVKQSREIAYVQVLGIAGLLPPSTAGEHFWTAARTAHALHHLHTQGIYLKIRRYQEDIIERIVTLNYHPAGVIGYVGTAGIQWGSFYRLLSGYRQLLPKALDLVVETADFFWTSSDMVLPLLDPELSIWSGGELLGKGQVSLNVEDVASNLISAVPLVRSTYAYRASAVQETLMARYGDKIYQGDELLLQAGIID